MESRLSLNSALFAEATPAGAYYAAASAATDPSRELLVRVLKEGYLAPLDEDRLVAWSGTDSQHRALEILYRLQKLDFIYGTETPRPPPELTLEIQLPSLLRTLSDTGRVVLADDNGFYLASSGFHHESAEEIAALASDTLALGARHRLLLKNNLNINSTAWAISDPTGRSELGFHPLYIGQQSFILIIGGSPRLQGEEFVALVQALTRRYA